MFNSILKCLISFKIQVLLVAIFCIFITRKTTLYDYVIADDASQHLLWMNDKSNYYKSDETVEFSELIQPVIFKEILITLNILLGKKIALVLFDLIRIIFCFFFSWFYVFSKFKDKLVLKKDKLLAILTFLSLFSWAITFQDTNMSRSFASIFLLFFVFRQSRGLKFGYSDLLVNSLAFFIYPPVALILTVANFIIVVFCLFNKKRFELNNKLVFFFIFFSFSLIFSLHNSRLISESAIGGESIDREFILTNPHVGSNGRIPLVHFWTNPIFSFFEIILNGFSNFKPLNYLVLISVSLGFLIKKTKTHFNYEYLIFFTGVFLYIFSILFPFKLYIPSRYVSMVAELFVILHISRSLTFNLDIRNKIFLVILSSCLVLLSLDNLRFREKNFQREMDLHETIQTKTKKGSMILTNDLTLGNMIPYFSQRSVFVNYEMLHAVYFKRYREIQDHKMNDWFLLFSLKNSDSILVKLKTNHVTHVLLKKPYFNVINKNIPAPYKFPIEEGSGMKHFLSKFPYYSFRLRNDSLRLYAIDSK
jgi:hypothetical protein